jgi:hypothetical protein
MLSRPQTQGATDAALLENRRDIAREGHLAVKCCGGQNEYKE